MIENALQALLSSRDVLLADGAMGTSLFALGLETGDSPELWNVDYPDRVAQVHAAFVAAESDVILTNTFGANRYRLALHGAQDRVAELNEVGAGVARGVADGAGRPVLVAGSIGPTGEIYQPVGSLSLEDGTAAFAEQAEALAGGGVDLLWIETISGVEELQAAIQGASVTDLPIVATMTFDTLGRTMMGLTPMDAYASATSHGHTVSAFGANCGVGPSELLASVLDLSDMANGEVLLVAKGNCGVPEYRDGEIHYCGSPEIMADYACLARDAGARIIGGCCGTTAVHVHAMRQALTQRPKGARPSMDDVERLLGPVKRPDNDASDRPRRGRRRRSA